MPMEQLLARSTGFWKKTWPIKPQFSELLLDTDQLSTSVVGIACATSTNGVLRHADPGMSMRLNQIFLLFWLFMSPLACVSSWSADLSRRGGTLYVVEPEPISPDNLAAYPAMDERRELAAAHDVLDRSAEFGFEAHSRTAYASEGTYASYDSWVEECVGVDPERAELIERHHDQLHEQFHKLGRKDPDGYTFARGNRLAILTAI